MPSTKSSSNWSKLQQKIATTSKPTDRKKRKRCDIDDNVRAKSNAVAQCVDSDILDRADECPVDDREKDKYIGLDCEMVGIGSNAKKSVLARCCLVDFDGEKIYDEFVRPKSYVTDFRTKYSGVRKSDLRRGKAVTLEECMQDVSRFLVGKILVGHALHNDLEVLMLNHPRSMIRDTATYHPYMRPHGREGGKMKPRALRDLTKQYLGITIQEGEHDPGIDAKMAMLLYRRQRKTWEESLRLRAKEKKEFSFKKAKTLQQGIQNGKAKAPKIQKIVPEKKKDKKTKTSMFDQCS